MGASAVGSEGAAPIVLEAERIDGTVASGFAGSGEAVGLRVLAGDIVVTAARARWADGQWSLEDGTWTEPGGTVQFGRAELVLELGAEGETPSATPPPAVAAHSGKETSRAGFRSVALQEVAFTPCTCDDGRPGNLRFRAARATLEMDAADQSVRAVVLRDAVVELRRVPVLPVPHARVPLTEEGFRWGLPEIGHGAAGWRVAVPFRWAPPTDPGDERASVTTIAPRWREARGFGLALAQEGPRGEVRAEGGWDTVLGRPRGVLDARGHLGDVTPMKHGPASLAWDVDVASDDAWARDMGTGWASRTVPWRESRARLVAAGAEVDAWLPDDGSVGRLLRVAAERELRAAPGASWRWTVRPGVEAGLDRRAAEGGSVAPRALGSLSARSDVTADLWSAELEIGAQAGRWSGTDGAAAAGGTHARVALPLWVDGPAPGAAPLVLEPGVEVVARAERSGVGGSMRGSAGPALRARFVGAQVALDLDARLGWTGGLDPSARGAVSVGASRLEVRSDGMGDEANLSWGGDRGGVEVGAARLVVPDDVGGGVAEGGEPPSAPSIVSFLREPVLASATGGWVPRAAGGPARLVLGVSAHASVLPRLRVEVGGMQVGAWENRLATTTALSAGVAYDDGCTRLGLRGSGALDGSGVDVGLEIRVR